MPEPDKQNRNPLAIFARKNIVRLAISVLVSILLGAAIDLVLDAHKRDELSAIQTKAYISIVQFAPWNIAQRYIAIVFTQGNSYAEQLAQQQEQQSLLFKGWACDLQGSEGPSGFHLADEDNPCIPVQHPSGLRAFYLSAHVPLPLRPATAFFDLLLHALFDQGVIGFLVTAVQVTLGALWMRIAISSSWIKLTTFYSCLLGVPLGVLALGSIAAIPLWLLALGGMMALKALPAAALGAQAGGTAWFVAWVGGKAAEQVGHEAIMKQVERVVRD